MSFAQLFFIFALLLASLPAIGKPTRTLEDAAQRIMRHFDKGCVVTAESKEDAAPLFAFAGEKPDLQIPPELWPFEIGSITKVFNSLLLAIAVQESRVSLDSSLAQLLEPTYSFKHASTGRITLRELATHRSGLSRLPSNLSTQWDPKNPYAAYTEEHLWADLLKFQRSEPPSYAYSNYGQGLLGVVLSKIYGVPWETLLEEKICKPLGLSHTFVFRPDLALMMGNSGKNWVNGWQFQSLVSAGGVHSTAKDLVIFAQALLHPEKTSLEDALQLLLTIQSKESPRMGLGWFENEFFGESTIEHGGTTGGFQAHLQVIPHSKTIRVVLTNQVALSPERILGALIQRPAPPLASQRKLSNNALSKYTGHFKVDSEDCFDIILYRQQLWLKRIGGSFAPLFIHDKVDRFFLKNDPVQLQFHNQDEGVTLFTYERLGRRIQATKSSPKKERSFTLKSTQEIQTYCGDFLLMGLTPLKVFSTGNQLLIQLQGQSPLHLYAVSTNPLEFESDQLEVKIQFTIDQNQQVNGFVLHQNGMSLPVVKKKSDTAAVSKAPVTQKPTS